MEIIMSNQTNYPNRFTRRTALATMASMSVAAAVARQSPPRGARGTGTGGGSGTTTPTVLKPLTLADLKGPVPLGQLGKVKISRVILGGNQIADYNHCSRLPYVRP
jgi:hypothetical protein